MRSAEIVLEQSADNGNLRSMRLVIVDDHAMFREAVAKACRVEFGHTVVGETDNGRDAITLCREMQPDVLILDLVLNGLDGLSVIAALQSERHPPKVLVLSAYCDDYTLLHMEHSSIFGFVDKGVSVIHVLGDALKQIEQGRIYVSETVQRAKLRQKPQLQMLRSRLTEWESSILSLIGVGLSDLEIADRLSISPRTVQGHRSIIMQKLNVKGTPKLMAFAIEHGYCISNGTVLVARTFDVT